MKQCHCGCGVRVDGLVRGKPRRFVSGHNLKNLVRTEKHRSAISRACQRAWITKRQRLPIGTTTTSSDGYVLVKMVPGKGPWRPQHHLVAEMMLQRKLGPKEIVHHINGDRADNRPENLFVCRDRAHHNEIHRSESAAMRKLLASGFIVFQEGHYEAVLPRRN